MKVYDLFVMYFSVVEMIQKNSNNKLLLLDKLLQHVPFFIFLIPMYIGFIW